MHFDPFWVKNRRTPGLLYTLLLFSKKPHRNQALFFGETAIFGQKRGLFQSFGEKTTILAIFGPFWGYLPFLGVFNPMSAEIA